MVVKIHALKQVTDETLRYRAQRASSGRSTEFIATVNGVESGLLSYEDWSDQKAGFIYEIYVLSYFRKRGIGTALLLHAEDLAVQLGCTKISLDARAFDGETNQEVLLSWYKGQGYAQASDDAERMEKSLVQ
ncbi:GNAT family N-acetyltransferase [Marinobacter nauticus]|uniref:GNAT family N-acetyltransferase n=1 Tax=Marinobacter nauticus TaxID=2743 RepID=UPI001CFCD79C|nr:GNAT family N-acetyltransferase [Marinobacter nauticus]